ncbi:MAG TPA: Gfo/Idh/MocA family oxidoreductase [Spirochaetales bacterium]|nr:Gfo/Idh/MocA family oxidoreductase [Spirochaetales bacterium]HPM72022.1 Gfo/Idh/MocA family oxidoreductase [Spirochaetales bacterium]
MDALRVVFAGCGRISDLHVLGYRDEPRAVLHGLYDLDRAAAERRAAEWGAPRVYASYAEVLADPEVDAVEVLVPHPLHEELAVAALRAGKHVSVQKPMTTSLRSADRMLAAARASGRVLKVAENYALYPPIVLARRLIDEGAIGEPMTVRIKMMSGGSGGWPVSDSTWAWRLREFAAGRGMNTFDHGHHMWATAWALLGPFRKVNAWVDEQNGVVDSPAVVMWAHEGPRRYGQCEFHYGKELAVPSSYYGNDEWIDVSGSRGVLVIRRCTASILEGPVVGVYSGGAWAWHEAETDWATGFRLSTKNFIAAMRGDEAPRPSAEEGRHLLAMDLAVAKSDRERRTVWLGELDSPAPRLYAALARRSERRAKAAFFRVLAGGGDDVACGDGDRARELTLALPGRFRAEAASGFEGTVGLALSDCAGGFSLTVAGRTISVIETSVPVTVPDTAVLCLRVSSSTWASILEGRSRIETAYLRGKLRVDGEIALALRLRDMLGL